MKVYVLRGISGSGKSTWCQRLIASGVKTAVVSADSWFIGDDGVYRFDPSQLATAHSECLREFTEHVTGTGWHGAIRPQVVVVDNTNLTAVECAPYCALALAYGHELEVVSFVLPATLWSPVKHPTPLGSADLATEVVQRSLHGVPWQRAVDDYRKLEAGTRDLPPWWPHNFHTIEGL